MTAGRSSTLIRGARIFDGQRLLPASNVLLAGGAVAGIGDEVGVPGGAGVVEGRGRTLLPGLIDCHVHAGDVRALGQALAFGDRRPYVVALLTLDGDVAPAWAKAHGIEAGSLAELAEDPTVLAAVGEAVAAANERLARVQQVKRWRLLPVEWTAETEELTPTLKLKRRVVHAKYADVIDALYAS